MTEEDVVRMFEKAEALLTKDHFVLTPHPGVDWGPHSDTYVSKMRLLADPTAASMLGYVMAEHAYRNFGVIDGVIGPMNGGGFLSQWAAYHLCHFTGRKIRSFYAEKTLDGKDFVIGGGLLDEIGGAKILGVDDVLKSGGSIGKVNNLVWRAGGSIVGVAALWNRGAVAEYQLGEKKVSLFSLVNRRIDEWSGEAECPLCRDGVPINEKVGKGAEFMARKRKESA